MNNFFRIIATSLVAASAFVPLCSCGSDNEPSEKVDDLSVTYEVVPYVWSDGDLLPGTSCRCSDTPSKFC